LNILQSIRAAFRPETRYKAFLLSVLVFGLGYGIYKGVLDNYLAEVVGMGEFDRGLTEFFRETPGLLMVLVLAALYLFSAETIYKIGSLIALAGFAMQSLIPANKVLVILAVCIYSFGEHMQLSMRSTLTLEYAHKESGGVALGLQNAMNQAGMLLGYLVVIGILAINANMPFRSFFLMATLLTVIGTAFAFRLEGSSKTDAHRRRFYFRKKYRKYYLLEVFYGARKQVFFTFGPYVLILFYGAKTSTISLLFAVSAVVCYFCSPLIGKIIDRLGYKTVMVADTIILVFVCLSYGFAHRIFSMNIAFYVCCVNYIFDAVISLASMASSVYVKSLSDSQEEVRATLTTGLSVNHLITILIALFGGWIWQTVGMETLFILSAILGLINSAYAASIKTAPAAPEA